jgi:hypothetical protein
VNRLTLFGLFAVTAMLLTYALENRSRWFILAFSGACVLGSIYGFLQGAHVGADVLICPAEQGSAIFRMGKKLSYSSRYARTSRASLDSTDEDICPYVVRGDSTRTRRLHFPRGLFLKKHFEVFNRSEQHH